MYGIYLKIYLFFWFFVFINSWGLAQTTEEKPKDFISSEVYFMYPQYFIVNNGFNYGFGIGISGNFKPFKVTTGLFYSTKNRSSFPSSGIDWFLNYFNVPFLFNFSLLKQKVKNYKLYITTGPIVNCPFNFSSPATSGAQKKYGTGISWRLGLQLQRKLSNIFNLYAGIYTDFKFILNDIYVEGMPPDFDQDRFLLGINIGLEWRYKKQ